METLSIEKLVGLLCEIGRKHGPDAAWTPNNAEGFARALLARLEASAGAGPVGEAVAWWNGCDETVPEALRFLAENDRPGGGEQRFNSAHLYQLAGEIERMACKPLYARPVDEPGEVERLTRERDCLAEAIAEASLKAGIVRADAGGLSGPRLMMLADDLASAGLAAEAALAETRERLEKVEAAARPIIEGAIHSVADEIDIPDTARGTISITMGEVRALRTALGDTQEGGK